jgi:peptide/nickel transport system permease protein
MLKYLAKRFLYMIPTLVGISIISFVIVVLPPGDYVSTYVANREAAGVTVDQAEIDAMRSRYGLGQPVYVQYWKWISGILFRGDFGYSMFYRRAVADLIWDRLGMTVLLTSLTMLFTWLVAFPIGIYSAVRQYSPGDYIATFISFLGVATPDFLLALVLLVFTLKYMDMSIGGLFSEQFQNAPWSMARVADLLKHMWIPMIILGTNGIGGMVRHLRANLLDELEKPYVTTARAKGQSERRLLLRYPTRVALIPWVSTVGWSLAGLVSGSTIVATILNLPITGPLLLTALLSEDMYLAGSFILMLSVLTVIGTLVSDILLAAVDPRIRLEG